MSAARDRLMRASAAARATRGLVLFLLSIVALLAAIKAFE